MSIYHAIDLRSFKCYVVLVLPNAPKAAEDLPKAKQDLKKLKERTYELKLAASSRLDIAIAGALASYKTGRGTLAQVVELQLKQIELNEKIIAELEEMIEDLEQEGEDSGEDCH